MISKKRKVIIGCLVGIYLTVCFMCFAYASLSESHSHHGSSDEEFPSFFRRKILNFFETSSATPITVPDRNCSPPDIEQFPRPLINYEARRKGALLLHIFVSLYMFLCLAVICDEYFVPSLEKMCKSLKMQSDVAGATFMAAGSSAPELATAVIAVFIAKDDIGIGTVVGSAVFNIAFVIGICGLFAGRVIYLNWWPMFRDCTFYLISILALLYALYDEIVTWVDSSIFLILYTTYIVLMFFNDQIEKWTKALPCISYLGCPEVQKSDNETTYRPLTDMLQSYSDSSSSEKINGEMSSIELPLSLVPVAEEQGSVFSVPEGSFCKVTWVLSLPLLVFCYFTIPDCRNKRWERWYFITFLSSCLWIGVLSYILVWMITIIGFTLGIKDTIMGLTFLAAGASIPDVISSLLVAQDGHGDMAVSNAVGSNVFDILLCLGLPWFLQTAVVNPGSQVLVRSRGLTYSTLTLLLTVVFLLLATRLNHWKLDKKYGSILLTWYGLFMTIAVLYESNIFGNTAAPMCPTDY